MSTHTINIISYFIKQAELNPDRQAIICDSRSICYSELLSEVKKKAFFLHKRGVANGDHVLLLVPMNIELYINLLAIFYVGAVAIVIDNVTNTATVKKYLQKAHCKAVIYSSISKLLFITNKELRKISIKIATKQSGDELLEQYAFLSPSSPALTTFTTGSTGTPKAALRSHEFLLEQYNVLSEIIMPQSGEVDFVTLPIVLLINLGAGATSIIPHKTIEKLTKKDFLKIRTTIHNTTIDRITASPFFLTELCASNVNEKPFDVKKIFTGGGPVFPSDAGNIIKTFFPEKFTVIYGSTEAEPISTIEGKDLCETEIGKGLKVGGIHENIAVKIIKNENKPIEYYEELPLECIGEIIVSGHHVLESYYNSTEAFKENKIVEGNIIWHRTGDAGYVNKKGELFLTGRANRMIYLGSSVLSPFIIENQLSQIAGVRRGTAMVAEDELNVFVEIDGTVSKKEIEFSISQLNLPKFTLVCMKKIPLDIRHRTKIDYGKLRNSYVR